MIKKWLTSLKQGIANLGQNIQVRGLLCSSRYFSLIG
jgi:hypothetical protein